jgi:uncharacterized protein DUF6152
MESNLMRTITVAVLATSLIMAGSISAFAHHAFAAEFDGNKKLTLKGTTAKMEWINPHAWLHIDVKEADGSLTRWMVELGPPNSLIKRGWTKQSVPAGMEVVVVGYQAKDGAKRLNGRDVTLSNGKQLFAGSSGNGAPYDDAK